MDYVHARDDGERNESFIAAGCQELSFSQVNGKNKLLAKGFVPALPTDSGNTGIFNLVPKLGQNVNNPRSICAARASIEIPVFRDLIYFLLEFIRLEFSTFTMGETVLQQILAF